LLGNVQKSSEFRFETNYTLNRILDLFVLVCLKYPKSDYGGNVGVTIDW
jgi:hypothetical protein